MEYHPCFTREFSTFEAHINAALPTTFRIYSSSWNVDFEKGVPFQLLLEFLDLQCSRDLKFKFLVCYNTSSISQITRFFHLNNLQTLSATLNKLVLVWFGFMAHQPF